MFALAMGLALALALAPTLALALALAPTLMLHRRVSSSFRKTAANFHYEFNIRHMAGVFQGMLMARPEQVGDPMKLAQLWLHESERVYGDRLVTLADQKRYKDFALEQAKKDFKP